MTAEERAHLGVAGSLYGVTKDRLFEITLGERRVTTREVAPLLVAVPVLGPERALQEDEYFSVSVDALGFDRNGLLWATGDERLYDCSVATGICAPQGILALDAWSIWFADNPQGEEVLLASDVGFTTSLLQRLAVPSLFGPLASQLLGRVELCTEPGPAAPRGLVAIAAGPVQMQGGVAVAVVRDEGALRVDVSPARPRARGRRATPKGEMSLPDLRGRRRRRELRRVGVLGLRPDGRR